MRTGQAVSVYDYSLSSGVPPYVQNRTYAPTPLDLDVHEGIEVGIVLAGAQERQWQGFGYIAEPGDFWLCATWEPHGWRSLQPGTEDMVVIFLPGYLGDEMFGATSWLSLFTASPDHRPRVGDPTKRGRLLALGREMAEESRRKRPAWESGLRLSLLRALYVIGWDWKPPETPSTSPRTRPAHLARIIPALRLVHSHSVHRVTVAEAAAACSLSRAQFCLTFRQSMGLAFGEFCLRARLALVANRLLDTDKPVETIAGETGFSDASHLHRSFVRRYGCTPARYRESAQTPAPPGGNGR